MQLSFIMMTKIPVAILSISLTLSFPGPVGLPLYCHSWLPLWMILRKSTCTQQYLPFRTLFLLSIEWMWLSQLSIYGLINITRPESLTQSWPLGHGKEEKCVGKKTMINMINMAPPWKAILNKIFHNLSIFINLKSLLSTLSSHWKYTCNIICRDHILTSYNVMSLNRCNKSHSAKHLGCF